MPQSYPPAPVVSRPCILACVSKRVKRVILRRTILEAGYFEADYFEADDAEEDRSSGTAFDRQSSSTAITAVGVKTAIRALTLVAGMVRLGARYLIAAASNAENNKTLRIKLTSFISIRLLSNELMSN